jgi:hypothetical protein
MSMELWVFSDKKLNTISEWQHAIDAEDYPLKLTQGVQFENLKGFLPAQLRGETCGFECYWDNADALMRGSPDVNFGDAWKFALALRWMGSSPNELRAAWMAGMAYARATDGVIFDDQEGKLRNPTEARQVVQEVERDWPDTDWVVDQVLRNLKLGPYSEN